MVRAVVPRLLSTIESENAAEAAMALQQMGVLGLCMPPEQQFDRLEFVVGCVIGVRALFRWLNWPSSLLNAVLMIE
jgi:hypothetical protein